MTRPTSIIMGAVRSLGCLLLIMLAACGGGDPAAGPTEIGTAAGQQAPALEGVSGDGASFRLADERGRPTVVVIHQGVACGLCRLRLQQLQAHEQAYRELGARIVAVTSDPPEVSARAAAELELGYPLITADAATLERWGAVAAGRGGTLPATYLVDENGIVRYSHRGRNAGDFASDAGLLTIIASLPDEPRGGASR